MHGEELNKRKSSRDSMIYGMHLLDWTQQEIAEVYGLTQANTSYIIKNITNYKTYIQQLFHMQKDKGKTTEEIIKNILESYPYYIPVLWAILLEGKNDEERVGNLA